MVKENNGQIHQATDPRREMPIFEVNLVLESLQQSYRIISPLQPPPAGRTAPAGNTHFEISAFEP